MIVLQTQDLTKIYVRDVLDIEYGRLKIRLKNRKVAALKDLNLSVEEGEIFGLLGPNGAGKTTTLKILMGLIFPTRGSATIMDEPLGNKKVKEQIGFLPENPNFYDYLRGWEFLDYYGHLYGMSKEQRRARIEELLNLVGLTHAANLPLKGYSKGMIQRIGLAQALINNPRLVFLDEPQSGLDPFGRKEIRDIILKLKEEGKTVFFSSHILSDAELICDRVGILHRGELIAVGALKDLLSTRIKEYEIVGSSLSEEEVKVLGAEADKVLRQENKVMFIVPTQKAAETVLSHLVKEGENRLVSFNPRQESLEEYFIRQIRNEENK